MEACASRKGFCTLLRKLRRDDRWLMPPCHLSSTLQHACRANVVPYHMHCGQGVVGCDGQRGVALIRKLIPCIVSSSGVGEEAWWGSAVLCGWRGPAGVQRVWGSCWTLHRQGCGRPYWARMKARGVGKRAAQWTCSCLCIVIRVWLSVVSEVIGTPWYRGNWHIL